MTDSDWDAEEYRQQRRKASGCPATLAVLAALVLLLTRRGKGGR